MKNISSGMIMVAVALTSFGACALEDEDIGTQQQETSALLMGAPVALAFTPGGLVSEVLVRVKKGWINSDAFELDIEITGLNGGFEYHGTDLIPLSIGALFDTEKDTADVIIPWTEDETPEQVNEIYTVCIQVLADGDPLGDVICGGYGPF